MASGIETFSGGSPISAESSDSTESLEKTFEILNPDKAEEQDGGAQSQKDDTIEEKLDILVKNDENDNDDVDDGQKDAQTQVDNVEIIRSFRLFARTIPFFWTLFYFLAFHEPNEVTTKYYGLYFAGYTLIIGAEIKFSQYVSHCMNLESVKFFNYLLKVLFSVFVSFVGEIEGQGGYSCSKLPSYENGHFVSLPLLFFFIEFTLELYIKMFNIFFKHVYESLYKPTWTGGQVMSKTWEFYKIEPEIGICFGKKMDLILDLAIVIGSVSFSQLSELDKTIIYCPICISGLVLLNDIFGINIFLLMKKVDDKITERFQILNRLVYKIRVRPVRPIED